MKQSSLYKLLKLKSQDRAPNWGESAVNRIKIIQDKYARDKGKKEKAGNLRPKTTIFVNTIWKQQKRKLLKVGGIILSLTTPPKKFRKTHFTKNKQLRSNAIYSYGVGEGNNKKNNIPRRKGGQKNILKTSLKSKGHRS